MTMANRDEEVNCKLCIMKFQEHVKFNNNFLQALRNKEKEANL